MMSISERWANVAARLKQHFGKAIYDAWLARIAPVSCEAGVLTISVPTAFLRSWVSEHYAEAMKPHLAPDLEASSVKIVHRQPKFVGSPAPVVVPDAETEAEILSAAPVKVPQAIESPSDPRMTFDTLICGDSNQLACAALKDLKHTGPHPFNPIWIYGFSGLGKTHMLQALAAEQRAAGASVCYVHGRDLYREIFNAPANIALGNLVDGLFGRPKFLIIDGLDALEDRTAQRAIAGRFASLKAQGTAIVVSTTADPFEMRMTDSMRSIARDGLVIELRLWDEKMARLYIDSRIGEIQMGCPNFDIQPAAKQLIARETTGRSRPIQAVMNTVLATYLLCGTPCTVEQAEKALRKVGGEPRPPKVEEIQRVVAKHFQVERADILSARRTAVVVKPRQVAMYLAKEMTLRSLPEIGRRFGGRDHTTVLHAVRKIGSAVERDPEFAETVEGLRKKIVQLND